MKKVFLALSTSVLLGVGLVAPAPASADAYCPVGSICLFDGFYFQGSKYRAWKCGVIYNVGAEWGSDKVRSFKNLQTGNVTATFYDWSGSEWEVLGYSQAVDVVQVTPRLYYSTPRGVDGVKPC
ncbi:hypothetical protein ACIA8G_01735 [Lentzea sp. NPDC051213]|uniref:hypothetical protein n=1 Tax=Lentzea sp. NPDC051213 TaxID=3364126 RepID=UPI0037B7F426